MFDFPNSPSVGQRVTGVGGIVYVWDGVKWTNSIGGVTVQSMGDVGRNLIHNPLFNIAQRGAGPFTANGYSLDRWFMATNNGSSTVTWSSLGDPSRSQIGDEAAESALQNVFVGSGAVGSYNIASQTIEDVRRLGNKTVTVSFWALATTGTPKLGVSINQYFGTGGSPSATVNVAGIAVTLATTWARYSVTLTLPSVAGKTVGTNNNHGTVVNFWFSAEASNNPFSGGVGVQSNTVYLWGVQLEIGSVATPLEKPDPCYDLSNCQRFYQTDHIKSGGAAVNTAVLVVPVTLPVTMRALPVCAFNFISSAGITGATVVPISAGSVLINGTQNATSYLVDVVYTASADL